MITVKLVVPDPPIVLGTTPGNFGFEYANAAASSPTVQKLEIIGPETVTITISATPTADDRHFRYAFTGTRGARSRPTSGARGNLSDSDATPSRSGDPILNWCVHFDVSVP